MDVPTDYLDPVFVRDPSKKYFVKDTEEYLLNKQDENRPIIRDLFKDLLK